MAVRGWSSHLARPAVSPLVVCSIGHSLLLYMILGVPFSWHKAALAQQLTWIGWSICVRTWTVQIPRDKLKDVQLAVGRLLWLTSAWHHLRPLLIPLYKALHTIPTTMVGIDHVSYASLITMVSDDLIALILVPRFSVFPKPSLPPRLTWLQYMRSHVELGWV